MVSDNPVAGLVRACAFQDCIGQLDVQCKFKVIVQLMLWLVFRSSCNKAVITVKG